MKHPPGDRHMPAPARIQVRWSMARPERFRFREAVGRPPTRRGPGSPAASVARRCGDQAGARRSPPEGGRRGEGGRVSGVKFCDPAISWDDCRI